MGTDDSNRTTQYVYHASGQVAEQIAVMPQGTDDQVTEYVYGGDDGSVSPVARRDLLVRTIYPDGDDVDDNVSLTYYADGALRTRTDQRGVELSFEYDAQGRLADEKVTRPE